MFSSFTIISVMTGGLQSSAITWTLIIPLFAVTLDQAHGIDDVNKAVEEIDHLLQQSNAKALVKA